MATYDKWARGVRQNTVREDEDLPTPDNLEDDLGLDEDPELEEDMLELNEAWAGNVSAVGLDPEGAQELMTFLAENEPDIHAAIVAIARGASAGDADKVEGGKQELFDAEQVLLEYPEFDTAEREKLVSSIVEYVEQADYPDPETPEMVEAVAHAIVEARGGEGIGPEEEPEPEEEELPELEEVEE